MKRVTIMLAWLVIMTALAGAAEEGAQNVAALAKGLASDNVNERVAAADALRRLGPAAREAAPALAAQFEHPLGWVRAAAMDALMAIGPDAVPAIVNVLETGSAAASQRAQNFLGMMGPDARAALPALRKAMAKAPAEQQEGYRQSIELIERPEAAGAAQAAPTAAGGAPGESTQLATTAEGEGGWPQIHGPRRDLASREKGLAREWPAEGPKLLWTLKGLGRGFSSVSIAGGRLYTMGDRSDGTTESQFVLAYDLATRRELWAARVGGTHLKEGPRCTPTAEGDAVYALGTDGVLFCLDAATGAARWRRSLPGDFGGAVMSGWKWSESPLVDGDRVVCTPGAADAAIVALNKKTGEPVWKCALPKLGPKGKDGAGYSSIVAAEIGGARQYVQLLGRGVVGVEAASGRLLWSHNAIASSVANISHPLVAGDCVFVANGYNTGSVMLKIAKNGGEFKAEPVYTLKARQFSSHHGGIVLAGGYVYGGIGDNAGAPACVELASGRVAWQAKAPSAGSATVLWADGLVIFRYDRGLVALAEATPKEFKIKSRFTPPRGEGPAWAHMAIMDGKLYLRHGDLLMCYEVSRK